MANDWKEYKIKDIGTVIGGGTPKTSYPEYWNGEIPWLSPKDLTGYYNKFITCGERNITDLGLQKSSAKILPKGTLLLTSRAPIGYLAIASNDLCTNQGFKSIIPNNEIVDEEYLYYLIKTKIDYLKSIGTGTTFAEISGNTLKEVKVKIPPLEIQNATVQILSSLDNKIELNRKMNQTLEEMAQALYRSWFVDFDPVLDNALKAGSTIPDELTTRATKRQELGDHRKLLPDNIKNLFPSEFEFSDELDKWIPKGWNNIRISELVNTVSETYPIREVDEVIFLNTGDIQKGRFLHNDYSKTNGLPGQAKKSIKKGDILYSEIRPINRRYAYVYFNSSDYVVSTKLMVLRAKTEIISLFIYYFLKFDENVDYLQLMAESRSGTFPQITFDILSTLTIQLPDNNDLMKYFTNSVLEPLYERMIHIEKNIEKLTKLRDTLLPKLISGEIEVPELI